MARWSRYIMGNKTVGQTAYGIEWTKTTTQTNGLQWQSMVRTEYIYNNAIMRNWFLGKIAKKHRFKILKLLFENEKCWFYRRAHGHTAEQQTQHSRNRLMSIHLRKMQELLGQQSNDLQVKIWHIFRSEFDSQSPIAFPFNNFLIFSPLFFIRIDD